MNATAVELPPERVDSSRVSIWLNGAMCFGVEPLGNISRACRLVDQHTQVKALQRTVHEREKSYSYSSWVEFNAVVLTVAVTSLASLKQGPLR